MTGRVFRAIPTLLRVAWAEMVAYRAEMVIWILTATMPLVMLALWNAAAADGPIGQYGQAEFARYFAITLVVRQLTGCWILWELNYMIRQGGLSSWLLRPMHPLTWNLAETLAAVPVRLAVLTPIVGALFLWRPDIAFVPSALQAGLFLVSVVLALLVSWLVQCLFGVLSFWADQSLGLFQAWFGLWALLSGYFLPIDLLPQAARDLAPWLPFHASLGAPIDVLTGGATSPWEIVARQLGWVLALGAALTLSWRAGVRRYGAYGA